MLSPFLNFHRPCLFPTRFLDAEGRTRTRYRYEDTMTPFEKLKSLPEAEQYLKPGLTFRQLEARVNAQTDLEAAVARNQARTRLFALIDRESGPPPPAKRLSPLRQPPCSRRRRSHRPRQPPAASGYP